MSYRWWLGNNVENVPLLTKNECYFRFFLYCNACQHPAQKASTQRHGQPAPLDIYHITIVPGCLFKRIYWMNTNSQCYQYYWYSRVYVEKIYEKIKNPNVTNITVIPWCMWNKSIEQKQKIQCYQYYHCSFVIICEKEFILFLF